VDTVAEAIRTYRDGEVIVREGDFGAEMFMILKGSVRIVKEKEGHETALATLGPGEIFGEMALVEEGKARSATAIANGDVTLLVMDKAEFLEQVRRDPNLAFDILKSVCKRLRQVDEVLQDLDVRDQKRQEHLRSFIRSRGMF
jgi:CRP/FNR family cyclic AMP-dependent transcriptional regulator